MPNIEIDKREFDELVGQEIENERMIEEGSMLGAHWHRIEGNVCDVETYPNRPDLLSVEGLARAYRGFFDIDSGKVQYEVEEGSLEVKIDDSVKEVRPFIGGAVVTGLDLSRKKINGLIQLQEKLHKTLGRKRDKIAIGLHDLSTVEGPFTYKAIEPEEASFTPLEHGYDMNLKQILDEHEKGQEYSWILEDEDKYPIIEDKDGRILSFPPIINNQVTEVDSGTQEIFIDVTGKDQETVEEVLAILSSALSERGGEIRSVNVDGMEMPDFSPEVMELDPEYFRNVSGLDLSVQEIVDRLEMMKYGAEKKGESIEIEVPAYRTDLMHQYDLIEDVVIAHRYSNIEPEMPQIDQIASKSHIQGFIDRLRDVMTDSGVLEANTYYLSSKEKLFERMEVDGEGYAEVANPSSTDQEAVRNWLTPSLFQTLHENRHHSYPQSFFEVSEVVELDDSHVGSRNRYKLAYLVADEEIDYTDARKILQVLERDIGLELEFEASEKSFFKNDRCAEVFFRGEKVGFIGHYSDKVTENWELDLEVSGFELDLEKIFDLK